MVLNQREQWSVRGECECEGECQNITAVQISYSTAQKTKKTPKNLFHKIKKHLLAVYRWLLWTDVTLKPPQCSLTFLTGLNRGSVWRSPVFQSPAQKTDFKVNFQVFGLKQALRASSAFSNSYNLFTQAQMVVSLPVVTFGCYACGLIGRTYLDATPHRAKYKQTQCKWKSSIHFPTVIALLFQLYNYKMASTLLENKVKAMWVYKCSCFLPIHPW